MTDEVLCLHRNMFLDLILDQVQDFLNCRVLIDYQIIFFLINKKINIPLGMTSAKKYLLENNYKELIGYL